MTIRKALEGSRGARLIEIRSYLVSGDDSIYIMLYIY